MSVRRDLREVQLDLRQVLQATGVTEPLRDLLATALRTVERTDRLLRDALDVLEHRGTAHAAFSACDMGLIVRDVVNELPPSNRRRVDIRADNDVFGAWNIDLLRRAIWHLLTNAIQHGRSNTTVRVDLHRAGAAAELSVHNEGAPIAPARSRRLLARAETSTLNDRVRPFQGASAFR